MKPITQSKPKNDIENKIDEPELKYFAWCPKCNKYKFILITESEFKKNYTNYIHKNINNEECVHTLEHVQSNVYYELMSVIRNSKPSQNKNDLLKKNGCSEILKDIIWVKYNEELKEEKEKKEEKELQQKKTQKKQPEQKPELDEIPTKPFIWNLENIARTNGLNKFISKIERLITLSHTTNPVRRNILLHGPFGTGKTMIVRVIINDEKYIKDIHFEDIGGKFTSFDHKDVSTSLEECFIKTIKEKGEKGIAILFIDEITGTIISGKSRTQINLIDTILRLTSRYPDVIIVGTGNNLSESAKAILRSGRFDIIEIGLPETPEERSKIIEVHMKTYLKDIIFEEKIIKNLVEYDKYHDGWHGRNVEDWTGDVTVYCENKKDNHINHEEFIKLLEKREKEIEEQEETIKEDNITICPNCNSKETKKIGFDKEHKQRHRCYNCSKSWTDESVR